MLLIQRSYRTCFTSLRRSFVKGFSRCKLFTNRFWLQRVNSSLSLHHKLATSFNLGRGSIPRNSSCSSLHRVVEEDTLPRPTSTIFWQFIPKGPMGVCHCRVDNRSLDFVTLSVLIFPSITYQYFQFCLPRQVKPDRIPKIV